MDETEFKLPTQVETFLSLLSRIYEKKGEVLLREVVVNGWPSIEVATDDDSWNGGKHRHTLTLALPDDTYMRAYDSRAEIERRIWSDLSELLRERDEHFSSVILEYSHVPDERWREESGVYHRAVTRTVPVEAVNRIWGPHPVKVFLSHRATFKVETAGLKESLARYGLAAFVAHEDIEPTREWHREIEHALFSMDALVALLTPDFHASDWTDHEVGVAIGRNVPVIAVRLGVNPYGLMGTRQALSGCDGSQPDGIAQEVFKLLSDKWPNDPRLLDAAIHAYVQSTSFGDSRWRLTTALSRFKTVTGSQIERILEAYESNPQNKGSYKGRTELLRLLRRWTGATWSENGGVMRRVQPETPAQLEAEDLPF